MRPWADRNSLTPGSLSRFWLWFTLRCVGKRFQRSSQGHAAHGKQWSMSREPSDKARPLQTQYSFLESISRTACSRATFTSRLGSDQVIAVTIFVLEIFRPWLLAYTL